MKKFSKILVPIDTSERSQIIFEYALTFGDALNLDILVLHVVDSRTMQPMPYSYDQVGDDYYSKLSHEEITAEVKKAVQKELDQGTTFDHKLNVRILVRFGVPYDQIVKTAKEKQVDFIVMGAKGQTALEEIFMGGVATKVSRRAECPVFLVSRRRTLS